MQNDYEERLTVGENSYFLDTTDESINKVDWRRVLNQDKLISAKIPLFPDGFDPTGKRILDGACGPGGWIREVVRKHPDIAEIVGFDNSIPVVDYARHHEATVSKPFVKFKEMNILETWQFPDAYFDMANLRLVVSVLPREKWDWVLSECWRVLKPGGFIRLTECEMAFVVEDFSPATSRLLRAMAKGFRHLGKSFASTQLAITPMLKRFLEHGGFQNIVIQDRMLDFSHGAELHQGVVEDTIKVAELSKPLLKQVENWSEEEYVQLYKQMRIEVERDDFYGLWPIVGWCGRKPA